MAIKTMPRLLKEFKMTPQEIFELIESVTNHGITVEMCDLNDDECEVVKTGETIDNWIDARVNWSERGEDAVIDAYNGKPYAFFENAQVAKGQQRKDICVIDCGEYRLVYTG
jgi:hypothetical protein